MIKKLLIGSLCFLSATAFACHKSLPTTHPKFCEYFKKAATCYCVESGLPQESCQEMHGLYNQMIGVFGSVQAACKYQPFTSEKDCVKNWSCYINGVDATGKSCNAAHTKCE